MEVFEYDQWQYDALLKKQLIKDTILALENLLMEPKGYICEEDECTIQKVIDNLLASNTIGTVSSYPVQEIFYCPYNFFEDVVYVIKKLP
jgi:hypothetical protein